MTVNQVKHPSRGFGLCIINPSHCLDILDTLINEGHKLGIWSEVDPLNESIELYKHVFLLQINDQASIYANEGRPSLLVKELIRLVLVSDLDMPC